MFSAKSKSCLVGLLLLLLPLLLQGCLGSVQYLSTPGVRTGVHADILNFSDSEIAPEKVDALFLDVARLMAITVDSSKPRPQVAVVSPDHIHKEYLRLRPSAKNQGGVAVALYIPYENKILIPYFDRTMLTHELAHYFTFQYRIAPRSKWEAIADMVVEKGRIVR